MGILGYQEIGGGGGGMCGMELYVIVQESKVRARCSPNFASHDQLFNFNSHLEKQKFMGDIGPSREKSIYAYCPESLCFCARQVTAPSGQRPCNSDTLSSP